MNQLATFKPTSYQDLEAISKAMASSKYFQDVASISQAIVKIQAGSELGLPPFASMTGIHIIKGKPALGANVIATLIKNDPRYNYKIREHTSKICKIEFFEDGESVGFSEFTAEEAKAAGTQNMNKFPKNMLFARALSNGAKWHTPGIFGGSPMYTPDELGASVDEDGYIDLDSQPESVAQIEEPEIIEAEFTEVDTKAFHIAGRKLAGKDWDAYRKQVVSALTNGRTESSKEMTQPEADKGTAALNKRSDLRDKVVSLGEVVYPDNFWDVVPELTKNRKLHELQNGELTALIEQMNGSAPAQPELIAGTNGKGAY